MGEITNNIDRIAVDEFSRRQERACRIEDLQKECKTVIPEVIRILQERGQYTDLVNRNIAISGLRYFNGLSISATKNRYNIQSKDIVRRACSQLLKIIVDLEAEGAIHISEELMAYLRDPESIISMGTPEELAEELRRQVKATLLSRAKSTKPKLKLTEEEIDGFVAKMERASIRANDLKQFQVFVSFAARNWIIDRMRGLDAAPRKAARQADALEKSHKEEAAQATKQVETREYDERLAAVRGEFDVLIAKLEGDPKYQASVRYLRLLYHTIFDKENDAALAERFPGTSRDARDQWRKRGRDFLCDLKDKGEITLSADLEAVLLKKTRKKR